MSRYGKPILRRASTRSNSRIQLMGKGQLVGTTHSATSAAIKVKADRRRERVREQPTQHSSGKLREAATDWISSNAQ
eukprot:CAMPEP_0119117298 /NCGR_PEP_ID=MMETSP1180-20130426/52760_1 /TAXON_ID=3052 ORGANISM="Chlamydomonas cf sp, Strain CCMP681" /NCGR_SAMPLE_ID=MMETSP1180 /ASSEMBLY_ACC=CAM_ASM_000741 /LENGTH=76 /DNA_ID=CAMNT_0007106537 /DNA_START=1172 /DNA_END=1402 /DNA_ORIENTATION=+